ncbi:PH domain-containing protein [Kribbella monticola]|uniref:PH domain-containing protein n=1 Tax=Kribbella monticola TaxID=2185285 RepID=UPI000DD35FD5|nr:PH domain-containing protein [Kribbella monticola]
MSEPTTSFATPYYRAGCIAQFALLAGATLAGLTDPAASEEPSWPGWLVLAVLLAAFLRATRLGITVTPTHVIVRSWLTTRRFPHSRIRSARATPYDGWFGLSSDRVCQLELDLRNHTEPLPVRSIVATTRSRRVQRIAYALRTLAT